MTKKLEINRQRFEILKKSPKKHTNFYKEVKVQIF